LLLFGGTGALLGLYLTGDFARERTDVLFLLLVALASLFLTIALLTLISDESVAQLKGRFGTVTVDLAGTVGVFFCCAAALYFGYSSLQENRFSRLGVGPEQLRKVIEEHDYILEQLGENRHLLSQLGKIANKYSQEELLRNVLAGQYCYFFKDPSEREKTQDRWKMGMLSIEARQEEPLLLLSGKTREIKFNSLRIAIQKDKLIYDWTAEDTGRVVDARASGIGSLDIVFENRADQGRTVKEMTGWYLVFGKAYGRLRLLPRVASEGSPATEQYGGGVQRGNACIAVAEANNLLVVQPSSK
jgi:hypothetical protein